MSPHPRGDAKLTGSILPNSEPLIDYCRARVSRASRPLRVATTECATLGVVAALEAEDHLIRFHTVADPLRWYRAAR